MHSRYVLLNMPVTQGSQRANAGFERKKVMTLLKRAGAAALVAATVALGSSAATAAPAVKAANPAISNNSDLVMNVQNRRHWNRGRHHRRGDWNRGRHHRGHHNGFGNVAPYIGLGIAGAILNGVLSDDGYAEGYYDGPGYGSGAAMQRCAAQFRSFEWNTGLYTTYGGDKRLCPYLG
jgi:hypothetical protein